MSAFLHWMIPNLLPSALFSVAFAVLSNYGIYAFVFHSKLGKRLFAGRKHYDYVHTREDILREIRHCLIPETLVALIVGMIAASGSDSPLKPWLSIRWDFSAGEIPRILLECFALFWLYEIYYFFVHRVVHTRRLFALFHSVHHRSIYPTPFTQTSVNLLEAVSFYSFYIFALFAPVNVLSLVILGLNIKLASLTQHLGHEVFPKVFRTNRWLKFINSTRYHQMHHSHSFKHNYGFQTSLLDRLFGTIDDAYLDYEKESATPASPRRGE